jgi:type II secretion system protein I
MTKQKLNITGGRGFTPLEKSADLNRRIIFNGIRKRCSLPGFTLMEVVIALAITSISLLALLRLHLVSARLVDTAELKSQAVLLADGKIAEALADGFPNVGTTSGAVQHGGTSFQWQREVANLYPAELSNFNPDFQGNGLRKISVSIDWKTGIAEKHLNMFTYVADSPPKVD